MDCLNNWNCIDACYKEDIQNGFSKCKCFDKIPVVEEDHLTVLATGYQNNIRQELGFIASADLSFQAKFFLFSIWFDNRDF